MGKSFLEDCFKNATIKRNLTAATTHLAKRRGDDAHYIGGADWPAAATLWTECAR
jgi:hypothetical protein